MPFDVFISHSQKDKAIAGEVCAMLEAANIQCWIAPRDIDPGADWAESIVGALRSCHFMVLIFSSHSNTSPQVKREVQSAFELGLTVMPFRIEDVQPGDSLKYYIGPVHWLDATGGPMEQHIGKLVSKIWASVVATNQAETATPLEPVPDDVPDPVFEASEPESGEPAAEEAQCQEVTWDAMPEPALAAPVLVVAPPPSRSMVPMFAAVFIVLLSGAGFFIWKQYGQQAAPELQASNAGKTVAVLPSPSASPVSPAGSTAPGKKKVEQQVIATPPPVAKAEPTLPPATPATVLHTTPAPTPDLMAWALEKKEHWPAQVKLTQSVSFPVLVGGHASGAIMAPAGTLAKVVRLHPGSVTVEWLENTQSVPVDATDLMKRLAAEMASAASVKPAVAINTAVAPPVSSGSKGIATGTAGQGKAGGGTPPSEMIVTTLAGSAGNPGNSDGAGADARFNIPYGVALDTSGNVYVADQENFRICKITPEGIVTTLAGSHQGGSDGIGSRATFIRPMGVAVDSSGNVYVGDGHMIRKITPDGVVTTLAGDNNKGHGSQDGSGKSAQFYYAQGIAVDGKGNVYVADHNNNTIRKITPDGVVTTLAGLADNPGNSDGTGNSARFNSPTGLALDGSGNLYVTEQLNSGVRKITPDGAVTTVAGLQNAECHGGVAVDGSGNVYVQDVHAILKITPNGAVATVAGSRDDVGSSDGTGIHARFAFVDAMAVDSSGNIYATDKVNHNIRKLTPGGADASPAKQTVINPRASNAEKPVARGAPGQNQDGGGAATAVVIVTTLAGSAGNPGYTDGPGSAALFNSPNDVAVDNSGNVYVADTDNQRIRKITPQGIVKTFAGSNIHVPWGVLLRPTGVAVDNRGNVYVADVRNIRKITPDGVMTPLAGDDGVPDTDTYHDGPGRAARFRLIVALAVDGNGNIYVSDQGNNIIRKVTPNGVVTTLAGMAGNPGYSDGPGKSAQFDTPSGVAVDGSGNVYVSEFRNKAIRKITPDGVVTTFARLNSNILRGLAVDRSGNVYVADRDSIRMITPGGVTTILAGSDGKGSSDGTGGQAQFWKPDGLAMDSSGNIYVADCNNHTIRKLALGGAGTAAAK